MRRGLLGLAAAVILTACLSGCGSSLLRAARGGNAARVKALLDRGADPDDVSMTPYYGAMSPLLFASLRGKVEAAKALLDGGADVNQRCPRMPMTVGCESAVNCAIEGGHLPMLELLISRGATIGRADADKARSRGHSVMVPVLERAVSLQAAQALARLDDAPAAQAPRRKDLRSDVDFPQHTLAARPRDYALVASIESYAKLPEASYAERDGQAVRRHLLALGYPDKNIIHLNGAQATFSGLRSYLDEWLPRNISPDSTVFFYYSGHGAPEPATGEPYLVPWDADPMFLESSAISLKRLYASLQKLRAREVIVALDACFSGAGGRSVLPKGARPLVAKIDEGVVPDAVLTVFAAASGKQITGSLDEAGHGAFTYHFLKGLGGGAKDRQGRLTVQGLFDYVKPRVQEEGRRQNREQTPALLGTAEGRTLAVFP